MDVVSVAAPYKELAHLADQTSFGSVITNEVR